MIFGMDNNKPYINLSKTETMYQLLYLRELINTTPNTDLYFNLRELPVPAGFNGTQIDMHSWMYKAFAKYFIQSQEIKEAVDYFFGSSSGYYIVPTFGSMDSADISDDQQNWQHQQAYGRYGGVGIMFIMPCRSKDNHYVCISFYQQLVYTTDRYHTGSHSSFCTNIYFIKPKDEIKDAFRNVLNTYYNSRNKTIETLEKDYASYDKYTRINSWGTQSCKTFLINGMNRYLNGKNIQDNLEEKQYKWTLASNAFRWESSYVKSLNVNGTGLNNTQWVSNYTGNVVPDERNYNHRMVYLYDRANPVKYNSGLTIQVNQFTTSSLTNITDESFNTVYSVPGLSLDIRTNESVLTTNNSPVQEHTDLSIWTNDTIKADVVTNSSTAVLRKTTGPRDTEGNASSLWLSNPKVELQVNNKYLIKKLSNQYQTNITLNNIEYVSPVNNKKYVLYIYYQVLSNNNMATMTVLSKTEVTN